MYGCESWTVKKTECQSWCFWIVVLEKTLKSPLDSKDIKLVNPKGKHPWLFIGRTDTEAKVPILWPPDAKTHRKDWWQEEDGAAEDEMVGWHHQLIGREFEQTLGDSKGQGSLVRCNLQGGKELETRLRDRTTAMRTYCIAQGTLLSALWWPKWEGNMADSLCCTPDTNTTLYSNYTPIKNNKKNLNYSWPKSSHKTLLSWTKRNIEKGGKT